MNRPKSDHDDAAWAFYKFFYGINDIKKLIKDMKGLLMHS